jgi:DNA-binding NarL/FixJ family response regulator
MVYCRSFVNGKYRLMDSLTILVIDDERRARETVALAAEILATRLGRHIAVLSARTGLEGIGILEARPRGSVQLVVLDIHLPGADIDGRLIGPLLRERYPAIPILPFTADRQPQTAREVQALGMQPAVVKPVAPADLADHLAEALASAPDVLPVPLQPFLADHAAQLVDLLQTTRTPPLRVALLATSHIGLVGLGTILDGLGAQRAIDTSVRTTQRAAIVAAIRQTQVDLLVCLPDALEEAEGIVASHRVPLLVYATARDAAPALQHPHSVIVGPSSDAELLTAIDTTLRGERYINPQAAQVLTLSDRDYQIVTLLLRGVASSEIAATIGISEPRLRHVIAALYDTLGIPHSRGALISWAQQAPLHLREEA